MGSRLEYALHRPGKLLTCRQAVILLLLLLTIVYQPNQVGFSYDTPTNGTVDLLVGDMFVPPRILPRNRSSSVFLNGTFASLDPRNTASTTKDAAVGIWHMLQGFLDTFPQYNPPGNDSLGVNLFAESYGGKYGPIFAETWEQQNEKHRNGSLTNSTLDINLVSLGIVNGCIDDKIQNSFYTAMAVNNSYGLQLLNPVRAKLANATFYQPGGCRDQIAQCRNATSASRPGDPDATDAANKICHLATLTCNSLIESYLETGRSVYDLAYLKPAFFPSLLYIEYLNSRAVHEAIGSVVNYTDTSSVVYSAFMSTGDWVRDSIVPKLASLLARGVRIGLIYGDRDYICNWLGGEAVSLSIALSIGGSYASSFPTAGYAPIIVNDSYIGGVVRQYGNLSFSRIYQAGHFVPAYQPETAFQVFARIITGTSLSTGEVIDLASYNTSGSAAASSSLNLPPSPKPTCFLRDLQNSCQAEVVQSILNGEGAIINGVWYAASSDWPGATSTISSLGSSSSPTVSPTLTGLFTATATPEDSGPSVSGSRTLLILGLLCVLCFIA